MTAMTGAAPTWASSSQHRLEEADLPSLPVLQTWVHRPQALAKCTISDVYQMRTVMYADAGQYAGRDVFLLNRFPCRMVELVGWVAGVDDKEKSQTVYLDDGDGQHVMCVTIRLSQMIRPAMSSATPPSASVNTAKQALSSTHFLSAKERKAQRKAAAAAEVTLASKKKTSAVQEKAYERYDIRVGDVVRVRGRIDEWRRGKEWIRQVAVEPAAGGSIVVIDPDEQHYHLAKVHELHQSLYSRPFQIPPASSVTQPAPSLDDTIMLDSTYSDSIEPSSEMSIDSSSQLKLCDPSRLRPSQLTDRTFRQYLLDHVSQETIARIQDISAEGGHEAVRQGLTSVFPEYTPAWPTTKSKGKRKSMSTPVASTLARPPSRGPPALGPSSSFNANFNSVIEIDMDDVDPEATPRRLRSNTSCTKATKSTLFSSPAAPASPKLEGFTITSLLRVPHLHHLASLVVDEQSRKEEKRRRRRVRDGTASQKDYDHSSQREGGWRLTEQEREARMDRLVRWVIRGLSEEGVMVAADTDGHRSASGSRAGKEQAYLPLPEQLLLPLLIPHIECEMARRAKTFMRRSDPRYGHGILLDEILGHLTRYGEQGRWERVGEWCVEDALAWGEQAGSVKRVGKGWITVQAS